VAEGIVHLHPGSLVVLEGLDRTGKSTQMAALRTLNWTQPPPVFTHMPSGLTKLTQAVYELTEHHSIDSPLARQFLHLACHAENMGSLRRARRDRGVILDRWWWSTVAYGWHGGRLAEIGVDQAQFQAVIDTVWSQQSADVVFLFTDPHQDDAHNLLDVSSAYDSLATAYPALTVRVPRLDLATTTAFLLAALRDRGLLLGAD
jgi:dTMP kinase